MLDALLSGSSPIAGMSPLGLLLRIAVESTLDMDRSKFFE